MEGRVMSEQESAQSPVPLVRATRFEVSLLPEDDEDYLLYVLTIEACGGDRWGVVRHQKCLGVDGEWSRKPALSEREDEWISSHRFDQETALRLAQEAAPQVTVNGTTAVEALRRIRKAV